MRKTVAVIAALLTGIAGAVAGSPRMEGEPLLPVLDQRISLDLQEADPRNVFEIFEKLLASAKAGDPEAPAVAVRLRGTIGRTLTLSVHDVTTRTALQAAAESLRCRLAWRSEESRWVLEVIPEESGNGGAESAAGRTTPLDAPIDLDVTDADLVSVVRTIVGTTGHRKLVVDRTLGGRRVSLAVTGTPVREVLDLLCAKAGCSWSEDSTGILRFKLR